MRGRTNGARQVASPIPCRTYGLMRNTSVEATWLV